MHIDDGILTPILIEDDGVSSSNRAQWFDPSMLGVVVELMSRNIRSPGFLARNLNGSKRPKIRETNGSDKTTAMQKKWEGNDLFNNGATIPRMESASSKQVN